MELKDIYKTLKPILIEGATINDLLQDIEASAWEYAFQCMKHLPRLKTIEEVMDGMEARNELFMNHYSKALKALKEWNDSFLNHYSKAVKVLKASKQ